MIIHPGTIKEAVQVSLQVPELTSPYGEEVYHRRLSGIPYLILVAEEGGILVGFKVGYQRDPDGSFYSWMGGVVPDARGRGVALALQKEQHEWARVQGYHTIRFKTRNRHKAMLHFALKHGFYLTAVEPFPDPGESRIWLEKRLSQPFEEGNLRPGDS